MPGISNIIFQYALIHQSDARTGGWYKNLYTTSILFLAQCVLRESMLRAPYMSSGKLHSKLCACCLSQNNVLKFSKLHETGRKIRYNMRAPEIRKNIARLRPISNSAFDLVGYGWLEVVPILCLTTGTPTI